MTIQKSEIARLLLRSLSPPRPARAESARAGCPEICLVRFWISPRRKTPQPLWMTCSSAQSSHSKTVFCDVRHSLLCFILCPPSLVLSLGTTEKSLASSSLLFIRSLCTSRRWPLKHPVLQDKLSHLYQPFLIGEMLQTLSHLCGWLDFLPCVHVSVVLRSPGLRHSTPGSGFTSAE